MCFAAPAFNVWAADGDISRKDIGDGAAIFTAGGANAVVVPAGDGLVMVDGAPAEYTSALLAAIDEFSGGAPIKTVFNTHWHYAQTGSNEALRARGSEIVSHENTRLWLGGDFYVDWQDRRYRPRPDAALPTRTFYEGGEMTVGGEVVKYDLLFQAHTDGDIYVYFPNRNILAVGGLLSAKGYPILDHSTGGWIGGMIDANAALLEIADDETLIIPESGPVQSKADLQAQHDMLAVVFERMKEMARNGLAADGMIEAGVMDGYAEAWGDPTFFIQNAYKGLASHTYDMGGFI